MSTMTLLTVAIIVYGALSRHGYVRALALAGATPMGAALVAGGQAVPTFYAAAVGAVLALTLRLVGTRSLAHSDAQRLPPGVPLLLAFLMWSTVVTLLAPLLFDGQPVLDPVNPTAQLYAAIVTSSNIAQTGYLVLGIGVVLFVARSPQAGPHLVGLTAGTITVLSLWRYLGKEFGLPFPEGVLDNSPGFAFVESAAGGEERFRGILSEPAGLATFALVTICYMLPRSRDVQGWRRVGALALAAAAAYLGTISTSTTFVVAGGVLAGCAVAACLVALLRRRVTVGPGVATFVCVLPVLALWLVPVITGFATTAIDDKVGSSSYDDRSSADVQSYEILFDTHGLGVGLGASRASSFLPSLLSTTGVVGTVLFTAAVVSLMVRGGRLRSYRPVVWALGALLVVKVISGPDLSDTSGILWISLGVLSAGVLAQRAGASGHTGPAEDRGQTIESTPAPGER